MARAIALGRRGRTTASPNPWVGSVVVSDGAVVGEGFHREAGGPHAEVLALAAAGERARGGTLYVSLEPCSHQGATGPCTEVVSDSGIARVVVALLDPDSRVAGGGIARLREAGLDVVLGVGGDDAARSLAPYLFHRRTGRAFCVAKAAVSIDGRAAPARGSSRWITGEVARADAHRLRSESQAVMVGSGTALADLPSLTVRGVDPPCDRQPLRVLCDARGRVPAEGPLFDVTLAPTLVLTTALATEGARASWDRAGAEVVVLAPGAAGRGVDLRSALELLGDRGVLQVLVEGGGTLHGALVRASLVNELVVYVGATLLGDQGASMAADLGPLALTDAPRFRLVAFEQLGDDVRLEYEYAKVAT